MKVEALSFEEQYMREREKRKAAERLNSQLLQMHSDTLIQMQGIRNAYKRVVGHETN